MCGFIEKEANYPFVDNEEENRIFSELNLSKQKEYQAWIDERKDRMSRRKKKKKKGLMYTTTADKFQNQYGNQNFQTGGMTTEVIGQQNNYERSYPNGYQNYNKRGQKQYYKRR